MKKPKKVDMRLYFAIAAVIFLIVLIVFRRFVFFALLMIGASALQYILYTKEIKINLGHVFFFSMLITRIDLVGGIIFLLVSGFFSEIFAGHLEAKTLLGYPLYAAVLFASSFFRNYNIALVGAVCTVICYVLLFFISSALDEPLPELAFEVIVPLALNLIYFISFSGPAEMLINMIT